MEPHGVRADGESGVAEIGVETLSRVHRHQRRGIGLWRCLYQQLARGPCTLESLPTVLRFGPYRFFFYSPVRPEPAHVHVEREESEAKFWLYPVRLEWSRGFVRTELRRIEALVDENRALLVRVWHEYFGN